MSRCTSCLNETSCEYYHDDTSCNYEPVVTICLECKNMFDTFISSDNFCTTECRRKYKQRVNTVKRTLETKWRFDKCSQSEIDMLDYMMTMEDVLA